jgi:hypothetical protein
VEAEDTALYGESSPDMEPAVGGWVATNRQVFGKIPLFEWLGPSCGPFPSEFS